jgi:hypothetical protein
MIVNSHSEKNVKEFFEISTGNPASGTPGMEQGFFFPDEYGRVTLNNRKYCGKTTFFAKYRYSDRKNRQKNRIFRHATGSPEIHSRKARKSPGRDP